MPMIQIKNLSKTYTTGDFIQKALDNVSLNFRKSEFVAILGPSGSGKTTFLNIVGGLDRYDSGDIFLGKSSTKEFKDTQWDAYRNKSVGFVFQSYNLISHLSIADNIELSMTLGQVNRSIRKEKTLSVLEKVGLKDHAHKKPNQLSGGQMQRVAIARALVNDPDIILADEPTGALDSVTSVKILELIKEIASEKLVVMVTHNQELAYQYSNRIVEFKDGKIVSDNNPYTPEINDEVYTVKRTVMNFWTALKLSFKNILTKKWRTALTAFASSIGIIGVALILSLSNGFDQQIKAFETNALSNYPLTIASRHMNFQPGQNPFESDLEEFSDEPQIHGFDMTEFDAIHINKIDEEYLEFLETIDSELIDGLSMTRHLQTNLLVNKEGTVNLMSEVELGSYPTKNKNDYQSYLQEYYDLLAGEFPNQANDLILVVDSRNQVDQMVLNQLQFDSESIDFSEVLDSELKLVFNDQLYDKQGPIFAMKQDLKEVYNQSENLDLNVVGILRIKEEQEVVSMPRGLYGSDELYRLVLEGNSDSEIVKAQQESEVYILSGQPFPPGQTEFTQEMALARLGGRESINQISIYPTTFEAKQEIMLALDDFNINKAQEDKILYTDLARIITDLTGNIMNGITLVLVAFAAISLVVSMIMIGIIIYISVLERTKEIGILRALGARKKDITRVFNAETFIIGLFSGMIGIGIAYLLTFPINSLIYDMTELSNVAQLNPLHALLLIVIAVTLTIIGGFIPSKMAAKKDPVAALRQD